MVANTCYAYVVDILVAKLFLIVTRSKICYFESLIIAIFAIKSPF